MDNAEAESTNLGTAFLEEEFIEMTFNNESKSMYTFKSIEGTKNIPIFMQLL